jgi:non-specific serine/threonine protein kinase
MTGGGTGVEGQPVPEAGRTNLPIRLSSFVGRRREMAQVKRMLAASRLLTLTGAGGCGKTALALATAAELQGEFPDGVWLVELATLDDPRLVAHATARALGLRDDRVRSLEVMLAEFLRTKRLLLVLDSCEHLGEGCARLAGRLLGSCADLRILATSREPLRCEGEITWVVPSLSLPDLRGELSPQRLAESEAVGLFVDRARATLPEWALGDHNAAAVARVCRRLDGIPLAIELAAARVRVLPVEEIAARLDDDFALLSGGSRTALPRHQSLKATVDWSYGLLSEEARAWFRRLGVFAGSFTLDAAAAVCGEDDGRRTTDEGQGTRPHPNPLPEGEGSTAVHRPPSSLDLLSELVDKSMVVAGPSGQGTVRYRLLEPLRQYARGLLVERGEAAATQRRHAAYYAALAEAIEPILRAPAPTGLAQRTWFDRLAVEYDNLRAAFRSAVEGVDAEAAARLVRALWWYWLVRGHPSEGVQRLEEALAGEVGKAPVFRARALLSVFLLTFGVGEPERARELAMESLALSRQLGDRQTVAETLLRLGGFESYLSNHEEAKALTAESLTLNRALGNRQAIGTSLGHLGVVTLFSGDLSGRADFEEGLAILEEVGDQLGMGHILEGSAQVANYRGDHVRAAALAAAGLAQFRDLGDTRGAAACLEIMAAAACSQGRPEQAAPLFGAAEGLLEGVGADLNDSWRGKSARYVAGVRAALGEDAFAAAWAAGRQMTLEEAMDLAGT